MAASLFATRNHCDLEGIGCIYTTSPVRLRRILMRPSSKLIDSVSTHFLPNILDDDALWNLYRRKIANEQNEVTSFKIVLISKWFQMPANTEGRVRTNQNLNFNRQRVRTWKVNTRYEIHSTVKAQFDYRKNQAGKFQLKSIKINFPQTAFCRFKRNQIERAEQFRRVIKNCCDN